METVLVDSRRGRFYVNPHDTVIGKSLLTYGEFAEQEMLLLSHWIRPDEFVIDVGANIGTHSVFFSDQVGPAGRVLSIEAQPEIFAVLEKNLKLNDCRNVAALNVAVGGDKGEIEFVPLDYGEDGNFGAFSFRIGDIGSYLPVKPDATATMLPVIALDGIETEACHLLKIDAEGMEGEILAGAAQMVERCRPIIYLENNQRNSSRAIIEQIRSFDYQAYWHFVSYFRGANFANGMIADAGGQGSRDFKEGDWKAAKKDLLG